MSSVPKVLFCTDEPAAVSKLVRQAISAGWKPLIETSPRRVLAVAIADRPDVLVLDLELPGAREVLLSLRSEPRSSAARIVAVGRTASTRVIEDCLSLGADSVLVKPIDFDALHAAPLREVPWFDPPPPPRCTLLIADDSPEVMTSLVRGARREGFATITDTTSGRVVDLAREHQPDMIVLDVHQRIDGRQLLADLKLDPQTRNIKVVMLSGDEDQLTRHDCFKLGAVDYFTKPLDPLFFRRLSKIAGVPVHY